MKGQLPNLAHGAWVGIGAIGSWISELHPTWKALLVIGLAIAAGAGADRWLADRVARPADVQALKDTSVARQKVIAQLRTHDLDHEDRISNLELWRQVHTDTVTRPTLSRLNKIESDEHDLSQSLRSLQAGQYLYAKRQDSILALTGRIDRMLRRLLCRQDSRSADRCELLELHSGGPAHSDAPGSSR